MLKKYIIPTLLFTLLFCLNNVNAQITVGTYNGIDHATAYTNPNTGGACTDIPAINAALGDADFINGTAEIPLGWSFSGTWNSGATYTDGPGSEVLLVSLHTYTETWSVALRLSDGSTTAFSTYALTIVTSNANGSLQACSFFPGPFNYERPSQELDFASYTIPAGVGVIGIIFEPLTDGAADPDPHGVIILQNTPILDPGSTITTSSTCFNTCNGTAAVVDGPDAPYTYQWDAAAGNATTQAVSNLCPGSYTVYANGATGTIDTLIANIVAYPELTISLVSSSPNICFGELGQILVLGAGTYPYQYSINGSAYGSSGIFNSLQADTYTLIVQDANSCYDTLTTVISEGAEIIATQSATNEICLGDCEGTISLNATGDSPFTYSIDGCTTNLATGNFTDLCAGNYNICIEDNFACQYTSTLTINPGVVMEIPSTILTDTVICQGEVYTLAAVDQNVNTTTYSWENGTQGPSIQISAAGTYIVTLSNLCETSTDTVTIGTKLCDIEVPNIISLAAGSQNPLWYVKAEGLSSFNLVITNRWGEIVFECDDAKAQCFWDGTNQGGPLVNEGTYFYIIDATIEGGEELQKQGFIQVVK